MVGAAAGAALGAAAQGLRQASWKAPPDVESGKSAVFKEAPSRTFPNPDSAARWASARYTDRTLVQGREYGASLFQNADGRYLRLSTTYQSGIPDGGMAV